MENTKHTGTRVYIPLWLGILLLVAFVLVACLVAFVLYNSFSKPRLFGPKDEFSSLGTGG
jgi:zona occludens toxin (predicted ATPase)